MTSMLLTERPAFVDPVAAACAAEATAVLMAHSVPPSPMRERESQRDFSERASARAAIARSDVLFLRVGGRRLLDHRTHELAIGLDPVGDNLPLVAVPLQELDRAASLMVGAGDLERLHETGCTELLEPRLADLQVLDAPAHLLGCDRLALAVLRLRGADGFDSDNAMHDAAVVVDRADA